MMFVKSPRVLRGLCAAAILCAIVITPALSDQPPAVDKEQQDAKPSQTKQSPEAKPVLDKFMRQKLKASMSILEGLSVEDFHLIRDGAKRLHQMSEAEAWRRSKDAMYLQYSNEYRQITQELIDAAKENNLDKSALKWMKVTMNCIDCHRYVREVLITRELSN